MGEPLLFLILAGLFATLTGGAALQEVLKQAFLREETPASGQLLVPYLAMVAGLAAMLVGGLQLFSLPLLPSLLFSVVLFAALGGLVWWRLQAELSGNAPPPF